LGGTLCKIGSPLLSFLLCSLCTPLQAKLFEHFADLYEEKPFKKICMLSERGMCDSCKGVMQQFKDLHPDVEINVVSNKRVEGDVWKRRMKTKK